MEFTKVIDKDTEGISKTRLKHEIHEMLYGDGKKKELTFKVSKHDFMQALDEVIRTGQVHAAPKVDPYPIKHEKNGSLILTQPEKI